MKRILITGVNSYVGNSLEKWLEKYPEKYRVDKISLRDGNWHSKDFSIYDVVVHVAGIAHVSTDPKMEEQYYKVNRDLTIDVAKKAKSEGVKQFIFLSSIIVYGDSINNTGYIDKNTIPRPSNFYGKSKLQAEEGIRPLDDENFKVVILRPPMIYGKGSKGNYPKLAKLARITPIFPDFDNRRSMIYIDNLCEFIRLMIDNEERGLFFPQNKEYVKTSEMVREIAEVHGRKVWMTRGFNPIIKMFKNRFGVVNKVFGDLVYSENISEYIDNYRRFDLNSSIEMTEGREKMKSKKVLFLVNHDIVIYNFRREIVERLLEEGYEVYISSPYGERIDDLIKMGCKYLEASIERHGTNIAKEIILLRYYKKIMKQISPDVVLTFTIKPNIYGGIAAKSLNIPYIANITGLGSAVENEGLMQKLSVVLYKIAFKKINTVFFQNKENLEFFKNKKIALGKHKLLPGSGVNLEQFSLLEYPESKTIEFIFISRIMKEKGIDQYLEAATYIRKKYQNTRFHVLGFCEEKEYEKKLYELEKEGIIKYHGMQRDIRPFLKSTHCTIHPTYYPEGMSNVLLETAASGRPIIATNKAGCREIVDNKVSGFLVQQKNLQDLISKIEDFLKLSYKEKKQMGLKGREKVEKEFNREIVVKAYLREISRCLDDRNFC